MSATTACSAAANLKHANPGEHLCDIGSRVVSERRGAGYQRGMSETPAPLRALALLCSVKPSPAASGSALIAEQVFQTLRAEGVECDTVRCVVFDIASGVESDMGGGDEWPQIREKVLDADILRISTPVRLGHPTSVTQRVLERLGTELIRRGRCTQDRRRCFPRAQRRRVQHPGAGCTYGTAPPWSPPTTTTWMRSLRRWSRRRRPPPATRHIWRAFFSNRTTPYE